MFKKKKSNRFLLFFVTAILCLSFAKNIQAHPHVFIDAQIKVYFDANGVKGFKIVWVFDKMFSEIMLDEFDDDVDDQFSKEEQKLIYQKAFINLKKFNYFTKIMIDNRPFKIQSIANFRAEINEEVMTYSFFIPCSIPIIDVAKFVKVYTYDESYYMDVSLTNSAISFANASKYNVEYQVVEDEKTAYYFNQILPFALQLTLKKK